MSMRSATTTMSSQVARQDDDSDYVVAAIILALLLLCIIAAIVVYSYLGRRFIPDCCQRHLCPCMKGETGEDIQMGYLPANITVNPGAVQQGVPDIFLRHSQSGRVSMEPYSLEISRESASAGETSATWADFLRRATITRRNGSGPGGGGKVAEEEGDTGTEPLTGSSMNALDTGLTGPGSDELHLDLDRQ